MLDWVTLMLAFLAVLLQTFVTRSKSAKIVERSTEKEKLPQNEWCRHALFKHEHLRGRIAPCVFLG